VTRVTLLILLATVVLTATPHPAAAARSQPPDIAAATDEFVPVTDLPPEEQLPAVPLVLIAYAFIWMAVLAYVFAIWKRLSGVQREIESLRKTLRS
jgi:CcmD family protein